MELSGAATKKEILIMALEELVKSRLRHKLKDMAGSGILDLRLSGLKKLRKGREKLHKKILEKNR
jgi:hypothetical protein